MSVNNALNEFKPIEGPGDGRDLIINCPSCHTRGARAVAYDLIETYKVVIKHRTTWVKCSACGKTLYSKLPADELRGLTPEQLESVIVNRTSPIRLVLVIAALVMCIAPIFGIVVAIVALVANLKTPGWLRRLSIVALVMSVLITAAFLILSQIFLSDEEIRARAKHAPPPPAFVRLP